MALAAGMKLGPYEVIGSIGAGGMGEVWKARDTNLQRDVALKVLPDLFAADVERLARFKREAHVLASLNHPNIAAIYGLETSGGVTALVLELIQGPTLADLIAPGPIPTNEALLIAKQIAEALEAAHAHGVIHRDLKPANVKVRRDGTVKVLDFGLAKVMSENPNEDGPSQMPTITRPAAVTRTGAILGTAAYLSPEQATGRSVDARSDIWALGCVVYEMVAGRAAFAQGTAAETVAKIIEREPDWDALPSNTSPAIRRLLHRCLEKDSRQRLHAAADVRIAIEDARFVDETVTPAIGWSSRRRKVITALLIVLAFMLVAVSLVWVTERQGTVDLPPLRLDVNTSPTNDPVSFALSPDGRQLVFVALEQQIPQLWLRQLDQAEAQHLAGTEGATLPFWAPDSRSIGFFADGLLKRLNLGGGRPQVLAQARNPMGGSWSRDDVILYSTNAASPLTRIAAAGGAPVPVTHLATGELSHRFPVFMPDGRSFLLLVLASAPAAEGIYLASLDAPNVRRRVLATDVAAEYAAGQLISMRESGLIALPFDAATGTVRGDQIVLVPRAVRQRQGRGAFSVSGAGFLAYRVGEDGSIPEQLAWFDRTGRPSGTLPTLGALDATSNGQQIAVVHQTVSRIQSNTDIWLIETGRGVPRQFTFHPAFEVSAVWSPDGSRIVFSSNRSGVFDLFEKPAQSARDERVLLATPDNKFAVDWSPDGNTLLFVNEDSSTGDDLWVLPFREPQTPIRFLGESHAESQGQFSPDGRWVAYRSNESGRWEIYLRPFPGPGSQQKLSSGGGIQPRWRSDGKELFYVGADSRMMTVPIQLPTGSETPGVGVPTPLFTARIANPTNQQFRYVVDPTGQRFLIHIAGDQTSTAPMTIVQNWISTLSK